MLCYSDVLCPTAAASGQEVEALHFELSMSQCSPEAWRLASKITRRNQIRREVCRERARVVCAVFILLLQGQNPDSCGQNPVQLYDYTLVASWIVCADCACLFRRLHHVLPQNWRLVASLDSPEVLLTTT